MISPVTEKVIKQLRKSSLSLEDRSALISILLDKLDVLPIGDLITFSPDNNLSINGRELDLDQTISFREACVNLKDNFARKVINEQIRHKATEMGIHKSVSVDTLIFSKAAIWIINEENILIEKLST